MLPWMLRCTLGVRIGSIGDQRHCSKIANSILVGAARASEAVMASVVARFLPLNAAEHETLTFYLRPVLHNWNRLKSVH